jgi:hypothetical protein
MNERGIAMNFTELSTLKRAVSGDLQVLKTYSDLLAYDAAHPVEGAADSANIAMAKRYFTCYIQALEGIGELLDRHIGVFEETHKKEQEAEAAKRRAAEAERREKLAKEKERRENKKKTASSLFEEPEEEQEYEEAGEIQC